MQCWYQLPLVPTSLLRALRYAEAAVQKNIPVPPEKVTKQPTPRTAAWAGQRADSHLDEHYTVLKYRAPGALARLPVFQALLHAFHSLSFGTVGFGEYTFEEINLLHSPYHVIKYLLI